VLLAATAAELCDTAASRLGLSETIELPETGHRTVNELIELQERTTDMPAKLPPIATRDFIVHSRSPVNKDVATRPPVLEKGSPKPTAGKIGLLCFMIY